MCQALSSLDRRSVCHHATPPEFRQEVISKYLCLPVYPHPLPCRHVFPWGLPCLPLSQAPRLIRSADHTHNKPFLFPRSLVCITLKVNINPSGRELTGLLGFLELLLPEVLHAKSCSKSCDTYLHIRSWAPKESRSSQKTGTVPKSCPLPCPSRGWL